MSITDLRAKAEAEFKAAQLKVETTYCELVEAGEKTTNQMEKLYLDAIDELNEKRAEVKLLAGKARVFVRAYGKRIVFGGLIVLGVLAAGYLSGWFAV